MLEGIKGLLSYLAEAYRIDPEGSRRHSLVHTSENGQCDSIGMDYASHDRYEVSVNSRSFVLNQREFEEFVSSHRLGEQDECDSLEIKYKGKPVQDYARYTGQANHFFSLVSREFGMWRLELLSGQRKFYDELNAITDHGDRLVRADSIGDAPKELSFAIRHSVSVGAGSGTIVELPGGRLGVITASHVIRAAPLHFPKSSEVTIDGKRYTTESVYDRTKDYFEAWGDDWAILVFSPEDARALRTAGYAGIHMTAREEYPDRFQPVFGLGFPAALQGGSGSGEAPKLEISSGYLTMRPGEGPEEKESMVTEEDGKTILEHVPDRSAVSSSAWACPGYSGGGLFWFNPNTGRVELIGVHVHPHSSHLDGMGVTPRDDLRIRLSTFHAFVDQERAASLLGKQSFHARVF